MALDRQSIEKKDFPIARRGYDPEQVDAHLARVAAEVEQLSSQAGAPEGQPRATSMAIAASDQVRSIIEAAEKSAAEIEQSAREDAAGIRADAKRAAQESRDEAIEHSREHVAKVQEATAAMLKRVDAMSHEIGSLVSGLSAGGARLDGELADLHANVAQLYDGSSVSAEPAAAEPLVRAVPEPEPEPVVEAASAEPVAEVLEEEEYEYEEEEAPTQVATPAPAGDAGADVEGARLIALNMALNGSSREETDAYLRENFDLGDRASLLDEVYATVEG